MRIGIGARLRLSLGLMIGIVLILGAVGYRAMSGLAYEVRGSLTDAVDAASVIEELRLAAREARLVIAASAAAATTTGLATADALQRRYSGRLAELNQRKRPDFDTGELDGRMAKMIAAGKAFANANADQQWSKAAELSQRFDKLANELDQLLAGIASAQRGRVDDKLAAASGDLKRSAWVFAAGIAGCFLLGGFLDLSLRRRLVHPLRALTEASSRIVEHGDLTQKIEVRSRDEIGDLAGSFQRLVEKLRQIPSSLREATDVLSSSVADLGTTASQQVEAVTRYAVAVQQTNVTAGEIRQTSEAAAQRAEILLRAVARADDVREAGESSVQRTLATLGDIASSVTTTAGRIALLKDHTRQIDAINLTVKDLADQSNMLALNAAIEAVRSGEHGKGFAVVAREIRSLADQSIQATTRVREILQDISRAIEDAARISDTGKRKAEAGLSEAQSSGETLRELSAMVKQSADGVRQIANTITQQNAGVGQIFSAVRDLTTLTDDTRKRVGSTEQAIAEIREVAARVSGIVKSYRT
jgi:methyl-accepting chemotaxis protein